MVNTTDPRLRTMLARTMQAEAGNQGYEGMVDVGSVIRNRVQHGGYGNGWEGVIKKPWQFSVWNHETVGPDAPQGTNMNFTPNELAYKAADAVLSGNYEDRTGGATHYYAVIPGVSEKPDWAYGKKHTKLGDHYFLQADAGRDGPTNEEAARTERSSRLPDFAENARATVSTLNDELLRRNMDAEGGEPGMEQAPTTSPRFTLPDGTPILSNNLTDEWANMPPGINPMSFYQQPHPAAASENTQLGGPRMSASEVGAGTDDTEATAEEVEEERQKFGIRKMLANFLFPDDEDPMSRLRGVGVAFGQMSAGLPVDLTQHFNSVHQQKMQIAQAAIDEQQRLFDNSLRESQLALNERQVAAQEARLGLEAGGMATFDPEYFAQLRERIPTLAPLVDGLASAYGSGNKDLYEHLNSELATQLGNLAENATVLPDPLMQSLARQFANAGSAEERADIVSQVPVDQLDDFSKASSLIAGDAGGPASTPGKVVEDFQKQFGELPEDEARELFLDLATKPSTNIDLGALAEREQLALQSRLDQARQDAAVKARSESQEKYSSLAESNVRMQQIFDSVVEYNEKVDAGEDEETAGAFLMRAIGGLANEDIATTAASIIPGLDVNDVVDMNVGNRYLTFMMAKELGLLNVGYTDPERRALESTGVGMLNTINGRNQYLGSASATRWLGLASAELVASKRPDDIDGINSAIAESSTTMARNNVELASWATTYYETRHQSDLGDKARRMVEVGRKYMATAPGSDERKAFVRDLTASYGDNVSSADVELYLQRSVKAAYPTLDRASANALLPYLPKATTPSGVGFTGYIDAQTGKLVPLSQMKLRR